MQKVCFNQTLNVSVIEFRKSFAKFLIAIALLHKIFS